MFDLSLGRTSPAKELAICLSNGLEKNRLLYRSPSLKNWERDFQNLLSTSGHQVEEVRSVLLWYLENVKGKFVPQAYSASSFCEKFAAISRQKSLAEETPVEGVVNVVDRRVVVRKVDQETELKLLRGAE